MITLRLVFNRNWSQCFTSERDPSAMYSSPRSSSFFLPSAARTIWPTDLPVVQGTIRSQQERSFNNEVSMHAPVVFYSELEVHKPSRKAET